MAVNRFNQIAAPNFSNSNDLLKLSMDQGNQALAGLTQTWDDAMKGVQNRVQGDMQSLINSQSAADLRDPAKKQLLQQQLSDMDNEGNLRMADMAKMNAYQDNRSGVLVGRDQAINQNSLTSARVIGQGLNNQITEVENNRTVKGYNKEDAASAEAKIYDEQVDGYLNVIRNRDRFAEGSPEALANAQAGADYLAGFGPMSNAQVYRFQEAVNQKLSDKNKANQANTSTNQKLNAGAINIASAQKRLDNMDEDQSMEVDLHAIKVMNNTNSTRNDIQNALDKTSLSIGGNKSERFLDDNNNVVTNWKAVAGRVASNATKLTESVLNPEDVQDFVQYSMESRGEDVSSRDRNSMEAVNRFFTRHAANAENTDEMLSEKQKYEVYSRYMTGGDQFSRWGLSVNEANRLNKIMPNLIKQQLDGDKKKVGDKLRTYYLDVFNGLSAGKFGVAAGKAAIEMGLGTDNPHFNYFPKGVQNQLKIVNKSRAKSVAGSQTFLGVFQDAKNR